MMKKPIPYALIFSLFLSMASFTANAGDFDWLKDYNIKAQLDPDGFKAQLAARFKIGQADVTTVIGNVKNPADAYMVLRMGELSSRPTNDVLEQYKNNNDKGWGVMAKNLGIKPGSKEFHALKRGGDLSNMDSKGGNGAQEKSKGKSKEHGNGTDKTKSKGKNND